MARGFVIAGESMVSVKGNVTTAISALTQLGLADSAIRVTPNFKHRDIIVDAWGPDTPPETQVFLADCFITMNLIHVDPAVLAVCIAESLGGASAEGALVRAGTPMGGAAARFAAGNHYIGLNISSPVAGLPWRFLYAYLTGPPYQWPMGTERSSITLNWRAIPYTNDMWGGGSAQPGTVAGTGAQGAILYDRTLDT